MKGMCVVLALLAAISMGAGVGDIVYGVFVICASGGPSDVCPIQNLAMLFTWLGSGVWGSIFVSLIMIMITITSARRYCDPSCLCFGWLVGWCVR